MSVHLTHELHRPESEAIVNAPAVKVIDRIAWPLMAVYAKANSTDKLEKSLSGFSMHGAGFHKC